ncbi:hypothetical protein Taro_030803 [Colocasia esculenta]|uniref:Uncharacterized protein n=1 Tax=Colocasia esculenta TaxID=4460 RepID=A0A843VX62_COLES|nr:hypothetical protein [Colocasia esculenta]
MGKSPFGAAKRGAPLREPPRNGAKGPKGPRGRESKDQTQDPFGGAKEGSSDPFPTSTPLPFIEVKGVKRRNHRFSLQDDNIMPTLLARFLPDVTATCSLCGAEEESLDHFFCRLLLFSGGEAGSDRTLESVWADPDPDRNWISDLADPREVWPIQDQPD